MRNRTQLCVVGLGRVGLPLALLFARAGMTVVGTDRSERITDGLSSGKMRFSEPGMDELYSAALERGICFTTQTPAAEAYIIAVPTPCLEDTHQMDSGCLLDALDHILASCDDGALVVVESTVAPGTIEDMLEPAAAEYAQLHGKKVSLAAAPERVLPGNLLYELEHTHRVIGANQVSVRKRAVTLYRLICDGEILETDARTAEMVKLAENTFRDINIAYANELALLCRKAGVDVREVIRCANQHPRVNILEPGPGVGGHCLPVDPWFLAAKFPNEAALIRCARMTNDNMIQYVLERLKEIMADRGINSWSQVGFYGLTYKEDTDDTRNSPGLRLAALFLETESAPLFYDPCVGPRPEVRCQAGSMGEFLAKAEIVVILTAHQELKQYREALEKKVVFDTRNVEGLPADYRL